jgi:peptidoglycan/xylan/chitin deacetylase (PgdA/CDA1 family)
MNVALTFDDGYREHLKMANYLAKRCIRVTFFVITGLKEYMGRQLLKPEEIRKIASLGHEIGSHSVTHVNMAKADEETVFKELMESKCSLSGLLGNEVVSFAYPYGSCNAVVSKLARQVYKYARTTYVGPARTYKVFDEHGCIVGFNLRLSNIYELLTLKKLDTLVLYTHLPIIAKLSVMLTALKTLSPRFITICEAFEG